jgi:hypothetical protein
MNPTPPIEQAELDRTTVNVGGSGDGGEQALVAKFTSLVQAPQFLINSFREMELDRKYVAEESMLLKTQDTVAVNHCLRLQQTSIANIGLTDPQPEVQPTRKVGGIVDPMDDMFAQTAEIWLQHCIKQMKFAPVFDGAIQDAMTNPWSILKVNLSTDYYKDPIGKPRFADQQDNVARLIQLKAEFASGNFTMDDPLGKEMTDLDQTIRIWMAQRLAEEIKQANVPMVPSVDPMTGMPTLIPDPQDPRSQKAKAIIDGQEIDLLGSSEIPYQMNFEVNQILPEDFRWAWTDVTRPEDILSASWLAHRVYMMPDEVSSKFNINKRDINGAKLYDERGLYTQRNYLDEEPSRRNPDIESPQRNNRVAVWEMWDRRSSRRYVWVHGMKKFLANDVPQACGRQWYPFFFLWFNRVTGQVLPLSDTKLMRPLQDEINMLRSHDREARRSAYPVLFIPKNAMTEAEKDLYRNRFPFSVIELERHEEINKALHETQPIPYNAGMFQQGLGMAMMDMQLMAGIPMAAQGATGTGDTATQDAIAAKSAETGINRRRIQAARCLTDILWYMLEVSLKVFPAEYVAQVCGPQTVWPSLTTEELYTKLSIEVKGGLNGKPDAAKQLELYKNFGMIASSLMLPIGPLGAIEILRNLMDAMDIRKPVEKMILGAQMMGPAAAPPGGGPGQSPGSPPEAPNKGAGPSGGAPDMTKRDVATDGAAAVPNSPMNRLPPGPPTQA